MKRQMMTSRTTSLLFALACLPLMQTSVTEAATAQKSAPPKSASSKAAAPKAAAPKAVPSKTATPTTSLAPVPTSAPVATATASSQTSVELAPQAPTETYNPHAHKGGVAAMLVLGTQLQGVGVRYYLTPTLAVQGQLGSVSHAEGMLLGLDALVERPVLVEIPEVVVSWHAGVGAAVGSASVSDQSVSLGYYAALAGVSADAKRKPVSVSIDLRAGLMQAGLAGVDPVNRFGMSAEVGVLYYFR